MGLIYKITNLVNNKIYIGKTVKTLEKRKKDHCSNAKTNSSNMYISKAIKKYGEENFIWEILFEEEDITDLELNEKEKYFIRLFNSRNNKVVYNLTDGGVGITGYTFTEESRKKMSKTSINNNSHAGINNPMYNKQHSEESKKLMSINRGDTSGENNPMYGKSVYSVWVEKYGKEEANRKQLNLSEKRRINATLNNPMKGKSVYDVWIVKYGLEEADKKYKEMIEKKKNKHKEQNKII